MPIYEYRCEKGHTFEVMQSMSDDPLTACEVCGAPVQKILHAPAVHFKGSGFYSTDYGKKKTAASSGSGSGSGSGDGGDGASSSNGSSGGSDSGSKSGSKDKKSDTKSASPAKSD